MWPHNLYPHLCLRLKNRHGHWLCWMSTSRQNGLMRRTDTYDLMFGCSKFVYISNCTVVASVNIQKGLETRAAPFPVITIAPSPIPVAIPCQNRPNTQRLPRSGSSSHQQEELFSSLCSDSSSQTRFFGSITCVGFLGYYSTGNPTSNRPGQPQHLRSP